MKKIFSMMLAFVLIFSTLPSMFVKAEETTKAPEKGSLTIHKYEQEKDTETGEGTGEPGQVPPGKGKALEGVVFEIKQVKSFNKITQNGEIVKEAVTDVTDEKPMTMKTNSDGVAKFDDLKLGRYEVKEISGPAHVNLSPKTYYVDVPMTSKEGDKLNYDVHIYPKNETKRGAVELEKTGAEDKALSGVEFTLYHEDGKVVENAEKLTTDDSGMIRVGNLLYGKYYFKETKAPKGYILDPKKHEFKIEKSGTINEEGTERSGEIVSVKIKNYEEPTIDKKIEGDSTSLPINTQKEYKYDIKTLLPEDIKQYKKYVVTDTLDSNLIIKGTPTVKIDGKEVDSSIVEVKVEGQKVTATVKDISKLDGNQDDLKKSKTLHLQITAEIKPDVLGGTKIENKATIDFENKDDVTGEKTTDPVDVIVTAGKITLTKVDGKDQKVLPGAEFKLQDKDGNVVVVNGKEITGVSDANGVITWSEIPYGEYQIVETKAPVDSTDGKSYQKLREPIAVKVDEKNKEITLTVENNKNGWVLPATGGMGTVLFTVVGLLLMAAAAFVFFRKKPAKN